MSIVTSVPSPLLRSFWLSHPPLTSKDKSVYTPGIFDLATERSHYVFVDSLHNGWNQQIARAPKTYILLDRVLCIGIDFVHMAIDRRPNVRHNMAANQSYVSAPDSFKGRRADTVSAPLTIVLENWSLPRTAHFAGVPKQFAVFFLTHICVPSDQLCSKGTRTYRCFISTSSHSKPKT